MRPGPSRGENPVPKAPGTIQKKKDRAEKMREAKEKYTQISRAALARSTTTVPLDRPTSSTSTSRIRPPTASALAAAARPSTSGSAFRVDPAAAAAIRAGPTSSSAATGRPTTVPRPSLVGRPSLMPRPTLMGASAPRPSLLPRESLVPSGSSLAPFEPSREARARILRNEPLPMAVGARASSIVGGAARNMGRHSILPGGLNLFSESREEAAEAERILAAARTPGRMRRGGEDRSRVRFEVEAILEQRESVGDEVDDAPTTSAAAAAQPSTSSSSFAFMQQRSVSSLFVPTLPPLRLDESSSSSSITDPPRSILKKRKSPGAAASSSRSISSMNRSMFAPREEEEDEERRVDENRPTRLSESRARATPTRGSSAKKAAAKIEETMVDIFARLSRVSEEEVRKTPVEMMDACIQLIERMKSTKTREEQIGEEDETDADEESIFDRGIDVEVETEEEEEEEVQVEQTLPLPVLELTIGGTPRRRSSRLVSSQGNKVSRPLFHD